MSVRIGSERQFLHIPGEQSQIQNRQPPLVMSSVGGCLAIVQQHVAQLSSDCLDSRFRCPQPGTILMGYQPLLLLRELSQWLPISSRG